MSDKKSKAAWDDEPTPLCEKERWQPDDDKARSAKDGCIEVVDFDVARDLERKLLLLALRRKGVHSYL